MEFIESEDFKGYDPYDALNSPALRALSFKKKWPRIFWIQTLKKLPINLRPVLGIEKDYNPKGLGLFLWGYAKLYRKEGSPRFLKNIDFLIGRLEEVRSLGYSGHCWGYNFDWQSRAFYLPRFTPTIVNTAFIGHALLDTYRYTKNEKALEMALKTKDFILNDLNRIEEGSCFCFSYSPVDRTAVHNANLLGASLLIRLYKYFNEDEIKETSLSSLDYSMKHQREDDSWYYAETDYQRWIDSFHTGFNLQSILYFLEEGYAEKYRDAFMRGVRFYAEHFFLEDGTPKYYHDKLYPIDIHSAAQAVVFFSRLKAEGIGRASKTLNWMINYMQDASGYFYYRGVRFYTNRIPYIRWAQAWAFHALTEYLLKGNPNARRS